jgi:DNA/RNA endonuclease G (NUC1)
VSRDGLHLLELAGASATTAGGYTLRLFIAGDVNADAAVDGVDAALLAAGQLSTGADADGDGVLSASDTQLLALNFGFPANRPPVLTAGQALTHVNLPLRFDLADLARDPDGDPVFFRVIAAEHGQAAMTGDGRGVPFVPEAGYSGPASFQFLADDGISTSTAGTVAVTVSSAPLIGLDFDRRALAIDPSEVVQLQAIGDFADQTGVPLLAPYVLFCSTAPDVAAVSADGRVEALADGNATIIITAQGLQAATVVRVGPPTDPTDVLLFTVGLNVDPGALTLPANGGVRQIHANIVDQINLESASTGTRYYASNPAVVTVSADGLVTAHAAGTATITVISGPVERLIPVTVEVPRPGPVTLGSAGGVVVGAGGYLVEVAPGALDTDTTVSITAAAPDTLPLPVPEDFALAGAFQLDVGDDELAHSVRLAVPVDPGIAAGTPVWFFRATHLPDATGALQLYWEVVEKGVVGADGIARTTSHPYPGAKQSGYYHAGVARQGFQIAEMNMQFLVQQAVREQLVRQTAALLGGSVFGLAGSIAGMAFSTPYDLLTLTMIMNINRRSVQIVQVPREGLPQVTPLEVELDPNRLNTVIKSITVPPPFGAGDPIIESVQLTGAGEAPTLVIKGQNFDVRPANGPADQIQVLLATPGAPGHRRYEARLQPLAGSTATELHVALPPGEALGTLIIQVVRNLYVNEVRPGEPAKWKKTAELFSEPMQLNVSTNYVFVSLGEDKVAVINGDVTAGPGKFHEIVARVRVGDRSRPAGANQPAAVAVTPDNSRAYVALWRSGRVAVLDALALHELDVDPATPAIDQVVLPAGAEPHHLVIDSAGKYAYVLDYKSYNGQGAVYVIGVDPSSPEYHRLVRTIMVGPAPEGLREMAIDKDGKRLYLTAPGVLHARDIFSHRTGKEGHILVVNVDAASKTGYHEQIGTIKVDTQPFGITASSDPRRLTFTNSRNVMGLGLIEADPSRTSWQVSYVPLTIGPESSNFRVLQPVNVAVTRDQKYAFVTAAGPTHNTSQLRPSRFPSGGTVGIIRDPFGPNARIVAATRPIPLGFPWSVQLSDDGNFLYVAYRGGPVNSVFVYNAAEMIRVIETTPTPGPLPVFPITQFDSAQADQIVQDARNNGGPLNGTPINDSNDPALNLRIDVRANLRMVQNAHGQWVLDVPKDALGNPIQPPLGVGDWPSGIAIQNNFLHLVAPLNTSETDRTPTFRWDVSGLQGVTSKLYVSVHGPGRGLFPEDLLPFPPDQNARRIVSGEPGISNLKPGGGYANPSVPSDFYYTLPDPKELTAGQTYYWGVDAVTPDGRHARQWGTFRTEPIPAKDADHFSSVTLLTHGFSLPYLDPRTPGDYIELAEHIAAAGGGGKVFKYDPPSGRWVDPADDKIVLTAANMPLGKPLVLVSDWALDSAISDSGFSEAAADALFASLVRLNTALGGRVFTSPVHLIGFSRGTAVTTEIAQRLGTYFPAIKANGDLHVTTLDPHDFKQESLDLPVIRWILTYGLPLMVTPVGPVLTNAAAWLALTGNDIIHYGNFYDPEVVAWDTESFHDNYWQTNAEKGPLTTLHIVPNFTPDGRRVPSADLDLELNGRAGFARDDKPVGLGGPHLRVKSWYAGTLDLGANEVSTSIVDPFNFGPNSTLSSRKTNRIWRSLFDSTAPEFADNNKTVPWYQARESEKLFPAGTAPIEGIGEGWFYSVLGGGKGHRPLNANVHWKVTEDNTNYFSLVGQATRYVNNTLGQLPGFDFLKKLLLNQAPALRTVAKQIGINLPAMPTVFNGDFDASIRPRFGRFPLPLGPTGYPSWKELPGWSFHGGYTSIMDAEEAIDILADVTGLNELKSRLLTELSKSLGHDVKDLFKGFDFSKLPGVSDLKSLITQHVDVLFHKVGSLLAGDNIVELSRISDLVNLLPAPLGLQLQGTVEKFLKDHDLGAFKGILKPDALQFLADIANENIDEALGELAPLNAVLGLIGLDLGSLVVHHAKEALHLKELGLINNAVELRGTRPDIVEIIKKVIDDPASIVNIEGPGLSEITHNRMFIPTNAELLRFDVWVRQPSHTDTLEVYLTLDGQAPQLIGEVCIQSTTANFVTYEFAVPAQFRGQVGALTFKLAAPNAKTGGAPNAVDSRIWLDNIEFDHVPGFLKGIKSLAATIANGDFGAFAIPTGLDLGAPDGRVHGWSTLLSGLFVPLGVSQLQDVSSFTGGPARSDHAAKVRPGSPVINECLVVPSDGSVLRFDIHVPAPLQGTTLQVLIQEDGGTEQVLGTIELYHPDGLAAGEHPGVLGFATRGFETFHLHVPDKYRGKHVKLTFLSHNNTVFLDNVAWGSKHLFFGNPDKAQWSDASPDGQRFLIERPQYTASYSNQHQTPNWVAWHLNAREWLNQGSVGAGGTSLFTEDVSLPAGWHRVQPGEYAGTGADRGHLSPNADRLREEKDRNATFLMTNIVPQEPGFNRNAWGDPFGQQLDGLEGYTRFLVQQRGVDAYVYAGGYGNSGTLGTSNVVIPTRMWKAILIVPAGQSLGQISLSTANVIAVDFPNEPLPPPTSSTTPKPLWAPYLTTVDDLEAKITAFYRSAYPGLPVDFQFDLFANIPDGIEKVLEERVYTDPSIFPLFADESPDGAGSESAEAALAPADGPDLELLRAAAAEVWYAALGQVLPLDLRVAVEDLPAGQLGEARITGYDADGLPTAGTIIVDWNADGAGWFLDPTPADRGEFDRALGASAFAASSGPAAGRYDLFTVFLHEVGHLAGFTAGYRGFSERIVRTVEGSQLFAGPGFTATLSAGGSHLDSRVHPDDLMNTELRPSVRKLPSGLDVQIITTARQDLTPQPPSLAGKGALTADGGVTAPAGDFQAPAPPFLGREGGPGGLGLAALPLQSAPTGIVNGTFATAGGWTVRGAAAVGGGQAVLSEDRRVLTGLSQIFIVPAGAKTLQFTIAAAAFRANGSLSPPDAFEVALLRDGTLAPLIGPAAGLTHTDAFLNVQPNGQVFFGPGVTVSGLSASGQTAALSVPLTVTVDLRTVAAGTRATLYFDLLGFGPDTSSVVVRDVSILVDPPTGGGSGTPGGGTGGGGGGGGNTGGGTGSGTGGSTGGTGSSPGETGGSPGGSGSPGSGTGGADGQGAGGGLGSIVTPGGSAPGGGSGSARQEPRLSDGGLDHGRGTAGEPAPAGLGGDASGTVSGLTIVVSSPAVVSSGPAAATPTARGSAALPEGQGFQAFVDAATQTPTTAPASAGEGSAAGLAEGRAAQARRITGEPAPARDDFWPWVPASEGGTDTRPVGEDHGDRFWPWLEPITPTAKNGPAPAGRTVGRCWPWLSTWQPVATAVEELVLRVGESHDRADLQQSIDQVFADGSAGTYDPQLPWVGLLAGAYGLAVTRRANRRRREERDGR